MLSIKILRICNRTIKELKKKSLSYKLTLKTIVKSYLVINLYRSINFFIRSEMQLNSNSLNTNCKTN